MEIVNVLAFIAAVVACVMTVVCLIMIRRIISLMTSSGGQNNGINDSCSDNILSEVRILKELNQSGKTDIINSVNGIKKDITDSFTLLGKNLREEQNSGFENQSSNIKRIGSSIEEKFDSFAKAQELQNNAYNANVKDIGKSIDNNLGNQANAQREQFELQNNKQNELQKSLTNLLSEKITSLTKTVDEKLSDADKSIKEYSAKATEAQEKSVKSVNEQLENMRKQNEEQLEKMRKTVDEKLQETLNSRITESFKLVSDRLNEVYTGLGEMKNLAGDVGDLKKVLSGVKTRGILGETQLGMLIKEMLVPNQYVENVITKEGSRDRVEFAVSFPGVNDNEKCYMPIDAKFPGDTYQHLLDAYDSSDKNKIDDAKKDLKLRLKNEAKDIRDKYIDPPHTTQFGILFLPFEGLYAEVINMGMLEELQKQYNVTVAGPTTICAILNSFQMGFRTLAIEKRSGEIEHVLAAVKTEFGKFGDALTAVQNKLNSSSDDLEKLVGVRTRQINRKLTSVIELPASEVNNYLPVEDETSDDE